MSGSICLDRACCKKYQDVSFWNSQSIIAFPHILNEQFQEMYDIVLVLFCIIFVLYLYWICTVFVLYLYCICIVFVGCDVCQSDVYVSDSTRTLR